MTTPAITPILVSASIVASHDFATAEWHKAKPSQMIANDRFLQTVTEQHRANFELWHLEDAARAPEAGDREVSRVKRSIDRINQRRNDLSEQCDIQLLEWLEPRQLLNASAELHSESPGLMIDRLSILSLKLFHTEEEIARQDAPEGHAERNSRRHAILTEQRFDLAACLDSLWRQVLAGQRRFKLYRQLKMYNDPTLNPAVYGSADSE
jgi:hypothetical protein